MILKSNIKGCAILGNKEEKLNVLIMLNVITTLLVILGHAGCVYAGKWNCEVFYKNSNFIRYITEYIYSFHMPLFVFISGYLYCNGKNNNKYKSLRDICVKKFKRLLIPYFFIGIFFMIPIHMIFNIDNINTSYIIRIWNEIILAKSPRHLWFLLMLFNLFIIFYIFEKFFYRNTVKINFIIMLAISIVSIILPNTYQISSTFQYMIYFYIGYEFCNNKRKSSRNKWMSMKLIHIILFNINYFSIYKFISQGNNGVIVKITSIISNRIISIIGVISIFLIMQHIFNVQEEKMDRLVKSNTFNKISKNTFYIYLIHQPIMLVILKKLRYLQIKPIIIYITLFAGTLIISFILVEIYNVVKLKFESKNKIFQNKL